MDNISSPDVWFCVSNMRVCYVTACHDVITALNIVHVAPSSGTLKHHLLVNYNAILGC